MWTSGTYRFDDWYWSDNTIISSQIRAASSFIVSSGDNGLFLKANNLILNSALSSNAKGFICKKPATILLPSSLLIGYKFSKPGLYFPQNQNAYV